MSRLDAPSPLGHPPRDKTPPPPRPPTTSDRFHDPVPVQHFEPDADAPSITQHPLWASSGAGRLISQDMEKAYSVEQSVGSRENAHRRAERGVKRDIGALVTLMTLMPFVSVAIAVYSLAAFLFATCAAPFFLCAKESTLKGRYLSLLSPGLNAHYKMAHSSRRCQIGATARQWPGSLAHPQSPTSSNFSDLDERPLSTPSVTHLLLVLLASPVLALPLAFTNLVIMCFWFMSALTDIGGSDGGLDDGRVLAKRVRRYWVRWLSGELLSRSNTRCQRRGRGSDRE